MSEVTIESRVSKIEEDFGEVKSMLQFLVQQQTNPTASTKPGKDTSSNDAGAANAGSAPKV